MSGQKQIILIHDPCDIRKKYSNDLENLGKVLDLEKNVINGYSTFNTIAVDEKHKRVHFVDLKVYSNKEPHFVTEKELKQYQEGRSTKSQNLDERQRAKIVKELVTEDEYINLLRITHEQLTKSSQAFKLANSKVHITHVLDSGFDDQKKFQFIDKVLKDEFVIRIKLSRNSSETSVDEENKQRYLKLKDIKFAKSKRFPITCP
jgi:hypothetical protein